MTKIEADEDKTAKAQLVGERELHHAKAERAYQQLKEDTALAKSDSTILVISFDLTLPTPSLSTNVVFYKRQLWTYNLGIHDGKSDRACMHMWHEAVASRGSNEVGSSILKYLRDINMSPTTTHLITYSDSCGGQNRNIYLVCLWLHTVACSYLPLTTVDQKFMLPGHSYLPNDRDFGNIELAKKKKQAIYTPDDWYALVQEARCRNPFSACEMKSEDFVSIKSLKSHIVNRKINTHKQPVNWLDIRWIRVTKDQPYHFSYKYSHSCIGSMESG